MRRCDEVGKMLMFAVDHGMITWDDAVLLFATQYRVPVSFANVALESIAQGVHYVERYHLTA